MKISKITLENLMYKNHIYNRTMLAKKITHCSCSRWSDNYLKHYSPSTINKWFRYPDKDEMIDIREESVNDIAAYFHCPVAYLKKHHSIKNMEELYQIKFEAGQRATERVIELNSKLYQKIYSEELMIGYEMAYSTNPETS